MKVAIIGSGAWGNALYSVIKQNSSEVSITKRGEMTVGKDVVVICVPTQSIRDVMHTILFSGKKKIVINTAKGIEKGTHFFPHQIVSSVLRTVDYYTLIGPGYAKEVSDRMPTLVNIGYLRKGRDNLLIKELFQTSYFRVRLTDNFEALELSAAFKNIYAIVCGLADGLGFGLNTHAKLLVLAIEEIHGLYKSLGLSVRPDMTAGTIGDLILTCSNKESRNYSFGLLLSRYTIVESLARIGSTVEGYNSLSSLVHIKTQNNVVLPLASCISNIVYAEKSTDRKKLFEQFIHSI